MKKKKKRENFSLRFAPHLPQAAALSRTIASRNRAGGGIQMRKVVKMQTRLWGGCNRRSYKEASLSSLQRASQLATNCLALTSRTFLSANEAGDRHRVCVRECVSLPATVRGVCVCVCFWKIESGETERRSNGVGSTAHFQRAVWHSLEGMRGWISLLAATATFQWGSTLSSPLSNPRWNDHLC